MLDPRIKDSLFKKDSDYFNDDWLADCCSSLIEQMDAYPASSDNPEVISSPSQAGGEASKSDSMFDFLDSGTDDAEDKHTESSEDELYRYLNMKPKRLERNGDPLLWWRKHETDFPRLASVARDVLAIPGMLLLIIKLGLSH